MHPYTRVLLYHEPMSAVLARVAYRLIELEYRRSCGASVPVEIQNTRLIRRLDQGGFRALATWVVAYRYYRHRGKSTAAAKQWFLSRARWAAMCRANGKPWARVPGV